MTTIQSSSSIAAASGAPGASNGSSGNAATEAADRFLTLLVSQLKNQDPLNPMDNAQITTQLAQISTVSGINRLNDTVAALAASFGANQSLQAASLVGHDVLAPGDKLQLAGGKGQGGFSLAQDADQVLITINDASGRAVRKIDLGSQAAGTQAFAWDRWYVHLRRQRDRERQAARRRHTDVRPRRRRRAGQQGSSNTVADRQIRAGRPFAGRRNQLDQTRPATALTRSIHEFSAGFEWIERCSA